MRHILYFSVLFSGWLGIAGCTGRHTVMTVNGPIPAADMGSTLTHEHVLVDFIGAARITDTRWDREKVVHKVLPYLLEARRLGCSTLVECTPAYIGRDPLLLKMLADSSGLNILTNTGYYGAGINNKYLPRFVAEETAGQLADRWVSEWKHGIGGTGIRPGFIKIGVAGDSLSEIHRKLVTAACMTHRKTGLVIASHTGPAVLAFQELEILKQESVAPEAFIWVHAQNESDLGNHVRAAQMGAWVSFDGLNEENAGEYVRLLTAMKNNRLLHRVLLSHDAGWYDPGQQDGGAFRGYATLFVSLIPELRKEGFTDTEIHQILVVNPREAFTVMKRRI